MRRVRVLLIHHRAEDASNLRPQLLAEALAAIGLDVCVAGNARRGLAVTQRTVHGARVFGYPTLFGKGIQHGYDPVNTLVRTVGLRRLRVDLVHAFDSRPSVIVPALVLASRLRIPLVLDWADLLGDDGRLVERSGVAWARTVGRIEEWFEHHFRLRAAAATVIAAPLAERLARMGFAGEVLLLRHGCDVRGVRPIDKQAARAALGLPRDAVLVGYLGVLLPSDATLLYGALERLRSTVDARLMLIGGYGLDGDRPRYAVATGDVSYERILQHLAACDVAVLPQSDTVTNLHKWPSKVADYMMLEKPIVATDIGDIADVLTRHEAGLVTPSDPARFADAIAAVLRDGALAARLAGNARRLAATELDWRHLAGLLAGLYERTLARVSGGAA